MSLDGTESIESPRVNMLAEALRFQDSKDNRYKAVTKPVADAFLRVCRYIYCDIDQIAKPCS